MTNLLLLAFDLSAPMSWSAFRQMPEDYQTAYLDGLIGRFGATDEMLSLMFGIHRNDIRYWRKKLGVDPAGWHGRGPGPADLSRWYEWLRSDGRGAALKTQIEREHPEVTVI